MKKRLAILASHPIQYQTPLWRVLSSEPRLDPTVFFEKDIGLQPYYDPEFGKVIAWDLPLIEGYDHVFLKKGPGLWRLLRAGNYDALMVHAWNSPVTWVALIIAKLEGVRTMLRAENPWNQEREKSGLKHKVKKVFLRIFFGWIDRFLYIGEQNRQLYLNYGVPENKLFFTPYAVDNKRFSAEAERLQVARDKIRAELGLQKDAVVFLTVGKLISKKRHMDLLRAYEKVSMMPKALVIVGEGELRPEIEAYAKERNIPSVLITGFKGQTEIAPYYAAADIFLLPSGPGETWGLAANEAMCFGLPLILSDMAGSADDLVKDGENGYVFPMGDVDALARAMEKLGKDAELRARFGKKSRQVVEGYSYEKDAEGILSALASFES